MIVVVDGNIALTVPNANTVGVGSWIFVPNPTGYPLPAGPHEIEFQYEYNPFNQNLATTATNPNRDGAVWIDNVEIVPP